jgi:deoxyribodipyrimidine photo-lyase
MIDFPSNDEAWRSRLASLDPSLYARTRNHINGCVSRLSPYLTHGFLDLSQAVASVRAHSPLSSNDKLFSEFAWRSFFHHVWMWAGEEIFEDMRPGLPDVVYSEELPADVETAQTGLPVIDQAVATLYETGYLHNHARMWLASYLVHLRHVDWRVGADWMYGHLLDGDLASNHLSWQWVASTFSVKPYLFNADNVSKFAPADWHCFDSPLDTSYEDLERMARGFDESGRAAFESMARYASKHAAGVDVPELHKAPPPKIRFAAIDSMAALQSWWSKDPPTNDTAPIELVHAWGLADRQSPAGIGMPGSTRLGLVHLPAHHKRPWSLRRWQFVLNRMTAVCDAVWIGDVTAIDPQLFGSRPLICLDAAGSPETRAAIDQLQPKWISPRQWLGEPGRPCQSFSAYSRSVREVR